MTCSQCGKPSLKALEPYCSAQCRAEAKCGIGPSVSEFRVERNFKVAGTSSKAAAAAAESAKLGDTHRKIWTALRFKPRTPDELHRDMGLKLTLNTFRARCTDLKNAGWIEDTGERRETDAGREAIVWHARTAKAEAA